MKNRLPNKTRKALIEQALTVQADITRKKDATPLSWLSLCTRAAEALKMSKDLHGEALARYMGLVSRSVNL